MAPPTVTDNLAAPATAAARTQVRGKAEGHTRRPIVPDREASADIRGASFRASWRLESSLETTAGGW